jgi:hypothetical protein
MTMGRMVDHVFHTANPKYFACTTGRVRCSRSGDAATNSVGATEFGDFGGRNGGRAPSDPVTAAGIRNVGGNRLGMGAGVME